MSTLVDTNILTRAVHKGDPMHQVAVDAANALRQKGEKLCLVPQNFYEFWVVCTRPVAQNGLGMTPTQVEAEIIELERLFVLLEEVPALAAQFSKLRVPSQIVISNVAGTRVRSRY